MFRVLAVTTGLFLTINVARAEMTADDCKALSPHIEPITKTLQPLVRSASSVAAASALLSITKGEHQLDNQAVTQANEMLLVASKDIGAQVDVISRSLDSLMTTLIRRCGLAE